MMVNDYPELYYRIYPKIISGINRHLGEEQYIVEASNEKFELIVDEVFNQLVQEYPEINEDPLERRGNKYGVRSSQRTLYGRRRIIRDLIEIFLIGELLRRSRRRRNPYDYLI